MKKFIFYIFSCNIGELVTIFIAIIVSIPAPLTAVLILSVNVGTDLFPALALGVESPEKDIMNAPPRNPKKRMLSLPFIARFAYIGSIIGAVVLGVFVWNLYRHGWMWGDSINTLEPAYIKSVTMAFATLVMIQLINAYNARSEHNSVFSRALFTNGYLFGAVLLSLTLLVASTEFPVTQAYLKITNLNSTEWLIVFLSSLMVLVAEELRKLFVRT